VRSSYNAKQGVWTYSGRGLVEDIRNDDLESIAWQIWIAWITGKNEKQKCQ
jgi:hypothetical protein